MAYSTSNPPALLSQLIGSQAGSRKWKLTGTDAAATVRVTGYITNGGALGMQVGDLVEYYDSNLGIVSSLKVATVSSTYPGAVDLADATTIGSATNSD
jgi:hypothetical protein